MIRVKFISVLHIDKPAIFSLNKFKKLVNVDNILKIYIFSKNIRYFYLVTVTRRMARRKRFVCGAIFRPVNISQYDRRHSLKRYIFLFIQSDLEIFKQNY